MVKNIIFAIGTIYELAIPKWLKGKLYRETFKKIGQALRDGSNNNFCIENQDSDPFHSYMI